MYQRIVKYKPKKLIPGKLLTNHKGVNSDQFYIGVPDKNHLQVGINVFYDGEEMVIEDWNACEFTETFKDKFNRGQTYRLGYFLWRPQKSTKQLTLL